jgi:hypothetical protein
VGERNAGVAARRLGRGDSRHHFVGNPRAVERRQLLGRSTEDCGVAPFEPSDDLACPSGGDHPLVNLLLTHEATMAMSAEALEFGVRASVLEDPGVY